MYSVEKKRREGDILFFSMSLEFLKTSCEIGYWRVKVQIARNWGKEKASEQEEARWRDEREGTSVILKTGL